MKIARNMLFERPCPFCGCKKQRIYRFKRQYWLNCYSCGAEGPVSESLGCAVEKWNKRFEESDWQTRDEYLYLSGKVEY